MRNVDSQTATKGIGSPGSPALLKEGTMLPDAPERLMMVRLHQAELRSEAAQHRRRHEGLDPVDGCAFSGLHLKIGRMLIVIGRTITRPDCECPDAVGVDPVFS
jgi:hypothetical protein